MFRGGPGSGEGGREDADGRVAVVVAVAAAAEATAEATAEVGRRVGWYPRAGGVVGVTSWTEGVGVAARERRGGGVWR